MDIETVVICHLMGALGVPLYHYVPKDPPDEFGTVDRSGDERHDLVVETPVVSVTLWAQAGGRARTEELGALARPAIEALPDVEPNVFEATVLDAYRDEDEATRRPQHVINARITVNV